MNNKISVGKIAIIMGVILVISIAFGYIAVVKENKNKTDNYEESSQTSSYMTVSSEKETSEDKTEEKTVKKSETETSSVTSTDKSTSSSSSSSSSTTSTAKNTRTTSTTSKKTQITEKVSGITYIKGVMIVNKSYALPSDYNPGVNSQAQSALNEMFSAASADGVSLWVQSGFRSYSYQKQLYENYAAQDGYAAADRYSARPGHSEHQTGLAFDLNSLSTSFGQTKEGKWLANNCWKYGFIIRYPEGKEDVTGYMYEPWHVRYLGKDTAKAVHDSGLTLEEYLGVDSKYSY